MKHRKEATSSSSEGRKNAVIQVRMLGGLEIFWEGQSLRFRDSKVRAMLAYLLFFLGRPVTRDFLASLLWDTSDRKLARTNLRSALRRLREGLLPALKASRPALLLESSRNELCLSCLVPDDFHCDIEMVQQAWAQCQAVPQQERWRRVRCVRALHQMMEQSQGEFLAGLESIESEKWGVWLLNQRRAFLQREMMALDSLVTRALILEEYEQALRWSRLWLEREPWSEEAHCYTMRSLASLGRREEALEQYQRCVASLSAEVQSKPSAKVLRLAQSITDGKVLPSLSSSTTHLPAMSTPFFGRDVELSELKTLVIEPDVRLVSVVGPGGIGKTRTSLEVARSVAQQFLDGAWFVSLAEIVPGTFASEQGYALLAEAVARPFGLSFHEQSPIKQQLWRFLQEKELLLVLDNFEHLLPHAEFVNELLRWAPEIKILLTSRHPLEFQAEHIFVLGGLAQEGERKWPSSAALLFEERAKRLDRQFQLETESVYDTVVEICAHLEGHPLGIELAASWVTRKSLDEIAALLKQDVSQLRVGWRDIPARHRSLFAAFEGSWSLLDEVERLCLAKLSVCQSDFSQEAASAIAGADLSQLLRLSQWFLLEIVEGREEQRFRMHPLLRQFVAHQLAAQPVLMAEAKEEHRTFFLGKLVDATFSLFGEERGSVLESLLVFRDDLRHAWYGAIEAKEFMVLQAACLSLREFYDQFRLLEEGEEAFRTAMRALQPSPNTELSTEVMMAQARLSTCLARMLYYQKRFKEGIVITEKAMRVSERLGLPSIVLETRLAHAALMLFEDPASLKSFLLEALAMAEASQQSFSRAGFLLSLTFWHLERGLYVEALDFGEQGLEAIEMVGMAALGCIQRRFVARAGLYAAKQSTEPAEVEALLAQALSHAERSVALAHSIKHDWVLGFSCTVLGHLLAEMGRSEEAELAYRQAIEARAQYDESSYLIESYAGMARLLWSQERHVEALAFVQSCLTFLDTHSLHGAEEPAQVWQTCYGVLHALGDPRAKSVFEHAKRWWDAFVAEIPTLPSEQGRLLLPHNQALAAMLTGAEVVLEYST